MQAFGEEFSCLRVGQARQASSHGRRSRWALCAVFLTLSGCAQATTAALPAPVVSAPPVATAPAAALTSAGEAPPITVTRMRTKASDFQAGMTLLLYGNDANYQEEAGTLFDQLATDNVNSLSFTIPLFQSGHYGTDVQTNPVRTPSDAELAWLIAAAHARGFTVMLRPLIDDDSTGYDWRGGWRGVIQPRSVNAWFTSYDSALLHYAAFAQANKVEILDIGSELSSMEPYASGWRWLIGHARAIYGGAITYSMDYGSHGITFGSLLDFVGVDAYYHLTSALDPSVGELIADWGFGLQDMLRRGRIAGRPVVVTETGVWPTDGVYLNPYAGSGLAYNPLALEKFYTATCAALKPYVGGIYWWQAALVQPPLPPGYSRWDPLSVPGADLVIANCYAPPYTPPAYAPPTPRQVHRESVG